MEKLVRVIVSKGESSIHTRALLSGIINTGDELVVDDEATGEVHHVQVSSIEVGDKRKDSAPVEDIKTVWSRSIEEVIAKIAVNRGRITESIEIRVPGEQEFIIGEKIRVNNRELKIMRIKIRDGGFKSRNGTAVKAKDIKRMYADSGLVEPRKVSKGGGRIFIKRRESVWSLKYKKTG